MRVWLRSASVGGRVLQLRLLGPVQVVRSGREVAVGGPVRQAVLAMLLVEAGRVVLAGRLIEELWRGSPPAGADGTLRTHVSRLRSALGPGVTLASRGGGYVIALSPGQLDAAEFERLARAGQAALGGGLAEVAADRFAEALSLWRGPALAGVADVPMLALEALRLEELKLAALEGRIEAELALGRHNELAAELEQLVAGYPARERFWCQLAVALYRGGRQADALAACRRARDYLSRELGLDPGEELGRVEQAVLRHQVPGPPPGRLDNLPAALTTFLGREEEAAELDRLLGSARLVTLTGTGGIGKTRLAIEVATRVADRFADGAWLADLASIGADHVPSKVMEALGVRQTGDVPAIEALRYRLQSADLLLVLDNCEHLLDAAAALACALLERSPGLRVLATSRESLGIPGEVAYVVAPLAVPPDSAGEQVLAQSAAVRLFSERAAAARAGQLAPALPVLTVARICRDLDGLPLGIELAAARTRSLSPAEIASRLADRFAFLAYRRPVAGVRHQTLKDAIGWSFDLLAEDEARVLAELSVFAGGFDLGVVASVCCNADDTAAMNVVDALAGKSLLIVLSTGGRTRYQLLETIRQYAAERLTEAGQETQARQRHAAAFADLAASAHDLASLAREHDNFRAALDWSLSGGSQVGPRLALALGDFWLACGLLDEARGWLERALECAPDDLARASLLRLYGAVHYQAGNIDQAAAILSDGARVAQAAGSVTESARIRVLLAEIRFMEGAPPADELAACEEAAAQLEASNDRAGLAAALLAAGILQIHVGDVLAASQALRAAADNARQAGNHHAEVEAISWLVVSFHELSVPVSDAIGRSEQLLETAASPWAEATILQPLALLYAFGGRFYDARAAIGRSQAIFTRSGSALNFGACAKLAGHIEMIAGNPAAAERTLTEARDLLQAQGHHGGYMADILTWLAEAVYAQGRFAEAEQLTEQTMAIAGADLESWALPAATRAKLLARRGSFAAAMQLAEEAVKLVAATTSKALLGYMLLATAEVSRLAGARGEAAAAVRQALEIYQDAQATALADQAKAALASLTEHTATAAQIPTEAAGQ